MTIICAEDVISCLVSTYYIDLCEYLRTRWNGEWWSIDDLELVSRVAHALLYPLVSLLELLSLRTLSITTDHIPSLTF